MKNTKNLLTILLLCTFCLCASAKKSIKITVFPTDAKIYVDGTLAGSGAVDYQIKGSDDYLVLKFEKEGYLTIETRYYTNAKKPTLFYEMRPDNFYKESEPCEYVNKYIDLRLPVAVNGDDDTKIDYSDAWKLINQTLLNYFDEIQTNDQSTGFVQTTWKNKQFPESEQVVRTRVTVRQEGISNDLSLQLKISSEMAPMSFKDNDKAFTPTMRMLNEYETLINDLNDKLASR